ncbi:transcriptional regulator [Escherichia coli]|nr:transcriptional regulator [Escherichia coli]MDN2106165.1 transcriptional regulator [Escherichia coli]
MATYGGQFTLTDEVLRLKQISGLTELFQEENFSPAWTVR